jgi:hypothetical protein
MSIIDRRAFFGSQPKISRSFIENLNYMIGLGPENL